MYCSLLWSTVSISDPNRYQEKCLARDWNQWACSNFFVHIPKTPQQAGAMVNFCLLVDLASWQACLIEDQELQD